MSLVRIFFLLAALPAMAQNAVSLAGGYGSVSLPNAAPWNSVPTIRVEFRLRNFSSGRICNVGSLLFNVTDGRRLSVTSFHDGGSPTLTITLPNSWPTEALFRVQRDTVARRFSIEAWTVDGSLYLAGQSQNIGATPANVSGSMAVAHNGGGGGVLNGQLAWLRVFNTSVAADGPFPMNQRDASAKPSFEFENNGLDSSGAGLNLNMNGATAYAATPVIPQVGEPRTIRAGKAFQPDCGSTGAAGYFWQQLSGPMPLTFSDRSAAAPTVTGADVFGQYELQCTAIDSSGASGASVMVLGAVATNEAGVVIPPTERLSFLLAPMLRSDASPWPFYDKNRRRLGFEIGASVVNRARLDIDTPLPGTISIENGSKNVIGTGTSFLSQYTTGSKIVIYYVHASGRIGRSTVPVASVTSDTALVLSSAWSKPSQNGVQHQRWGNGDGADAVTRWTDGLNYYDNVLALYVSYYKTGLKQIADYADELARLWWLYLDRGNHIAAPRLQAYEGVMIAVERGMFDPAEVYPAVQNYSYDVGGGPGYKNYIADRNTSTNYQNFYFGARESGYAWRFAVALGRLHPTETTRNAWLTRLAANIQNHYRDYQCKSSNPANPGRCRSPHGSFRWGDSFWNNDYAEQPWHTGIAMQGIIRYHRWTGNATARTVINDWVNFLMTATQPGGAGDGRLYQDNIPSSFAGIPCRRHYYWHLQGSEGTPANGAHAGAGCAGNADAVYGARDTNNEMVSSYGYAYRQTGDVSLKMRGDNIFGGTWGADDGFHGQWVWPGASNRFKTHGQGLCCNDSYLVDRLNEPEASTIAVPVPVQVSFRLTGVAGATSVRATLVKPDGTEVATVCAASPCAVTADRTQGRHRLRLEYLSAGGAVLSRSDPQPVEIR